MSFIRQAERTRVAKALAQAQSKSLPTVEWKPKMLNQVQHDICFATLNLFQGLYTAWFCNRSHYDFIIF